MRKFLTGILFVFFCFIASAQTGKAYKLTQEEFDRLETIIQKSKDIKVPKEVESIFIENARKQGIPQNLALRSLVFAMPLFNNNLSKEEKTFFIDYVILRASNSRQNYPVEFFKSELLKLKQQK
jgi:hypothetical protein